MAGIPWLVLFAGLLALVAAGFLVSGLLRGEVHTFLKVRREADMVPVSRRRDPRGYWIHLGTWALVAFGNIAYVLHAGFGLQL